MSEKAKELVLWFDDVRKADIPLVGGKNASLGEMINAGLPVPPGFAVTAYSYEKYIEEKNIAAQIYKIITETVTNPNDPKQYDVASKKIRELIEKTPMPKEIENAIRTAYKELNQRLELKDVFVAVRSSATAEDLPDASFAGQQETFLNVKGADELIRQSSEMLVKPLYAKSNLLPKRKRLSTRKSLHKRRESKKWLTLAALESCLP